MKDSSDENINTLIIFGYFITLHKKLQILAAQFKFLNYAYQHLLGCYHLITVHLFEAML